MTVPPWQDYIDLLSGEERYRVLCYLIQRGLETGVVGYHKGYNFDEMDCDADELYDPATGTDLRQMWKGQVSLY